MAELGTPGRKVVIDAGAAIKLQRLERFGGELFTTGGVFREIRDENARALLRTLPQELRVREPITQDIQFVKQFAKITGDLGHLSQNDIELMALTVALHREAGGAALRQRPAAFAWGESGGASNADWAPSRPEGKQGTSTSSSKAADASAKEADAPAKEESVSQEQDAPDARGAAKPPTSAGDDAVATEGLDEELTRREADASEAIPAEDKAESKDSEQRHDGEAEAQLGGNAEHNAEVKAESDDDSEEGSSAGEWVTPQNMHRFGLGVQEADGAESLKVTCATSDYSVQNVLLQMGITPLTFDGYAVRTVKLWGMICRACFFFSRDSENVFCKKCGNDTCVRVPIVVGEDGKPTVLNNGRKLRTKGTVYSVPKPQGGRGWKPVFAADEMMIGGRDRELRHQQRLADKERQAVDPFDDASRAWYHRGTTSTGKTVDRNVARVQAGYGRRNPNANNFKFKPKKR